MGRHRPNARHSAAPGRRRAASRRAGLSPRAGAQQLHLVDAQSGRVVCGTVEAALGSDAGTFSVLATGPRRASRAAEKWSTRGPRRHGGTRRRGRGWPPGHIPPRLVPGRPASPAAGRREPLSPTGQPANLPHATPREGAGPDSDHLSPKRLMATAESRGASSTKAPRSAPEGGQGKARRRPRARATMGPASAPSGG